MQTTTDLFERELRKLLEAEIERLSDSISTGYGVTDFAHYKYFVGAIHGIKDALVRCDEARSIVDKAR